MISDFPCFRCGKRYELSHSEATGAAFQASTHVCDGADLHDVTFPHISGPGGIVTTAAPAEIREQVEALLAEVYLPEGVQIWLRSRHRWLGMERAVDLIEDGRGAEVLAAVERLVGGAW